MTRRFQKFYYFTFIAIVLSLSTSVPAQTRTYRISDLQVKNLINSIETKTNTFRRTVDKGLDRSSINGTNREDEINSYMNDFEDATDTLKDNFANRRSSAGDVQGVLNRAGFINNFMRLTTFSLATQQQWTSIRTDLNSLANGYNVNWNWNSTYPTVSNIPYRVSDNQVKSLLVRIEQRSDIFRRDLDAWLDRSRLNNTKREDNFNEYAAAFENATDRLRKNFDARNSVATDAEEVLRRGAVIDRFVNENRFSRSVERQWQLLRSDLSSLASYYNVSWNWSNPSYPNDNFPNGQYAPFDSRLTGTYRLNVGQSDNVSRTVDTAISNAKYNSNQRDRTRQNLERRLTSPESLMIQKRGLEVTLASSAMQQVSFNADGVTRSETSNNGRTVNVRAASTNSELTLSYEGDRMNDYLVTFTPLNNGQLRISRRIYLENRNETVTINSIYDKIDTTPRWNSTTYPTITGAGNVNDFVVPNDTRMTATLNTPLSTKTAKDADRFTMTVNSPSQFQGAIIEGRVIGEKSGMISGRATLSLSFETIRLSNGNTFRFSGIVEQVREPNGENVSVNNEGTVRDGSQTTKTVTRAGIGAVLGAIIGAVVDGGQGAAIGAGIGAGAGAGSVILQGRDNLELSSGTEFTLTSTAPENRAVGQ